MMVSLYHLNRLLHEVLLLFNGSEYFSQYPIFLAICRGLAYGLWEAKDVGLNLWGNIT